MATTTQEIKTPRFLSKKLSERDVLMIIADDATHAELAARWSVSMWTIGAIKRGKLWPHLSRRRLRARRNLHLTETQVRAILRDPKPTKTLAAEYGVSPCCIQQLRAGKSWKHIPRPKSNRLNKPVVGD